MVLVKPKPIAEDAAGHGALLATLAPPGEALVVMEATGHYWKNLFAVLAAKGYEVALINPLRTHRFQGESLERTKTDAIDALGLARFGRKKNPPSTRLGSRAREDLRELVRHRDRLRQDFDDRVRQLHRLVDPGFPEFHRYVRTLDSMLATAILAEYPTAEAVAKATPRRLAKLRYDGRHAVGHELADQLIAAAERSVGQHHGPAYRAQVRDICQDLNLWRRRLAERDDDIARLLDEHEVGSLLTSIDGIGPGTAARLIAELGDPARFDSAAALAAYVGVVPALRQPGKRRPTWAGITPIGNARLRTALWMPTLTAVRRNPWLKAFYDRLRAKGKPPKLALIAAMRKLLVAVYAVAKARKPFEPMLPT
ncbi:IS110 family transposase [Azospirillum sp. RWY-5-1]|uniref:IS110 family transposase n=2 Tax=Azospirillum oleiclasticum TaxID=2735135 RepID=A0ABX2TLI7_9PROT|nr:IS110 family transposase [Azospirillum oleiclasticum]NYZ25183.1 IS110 family transposase [Azospirillum oleiclasticum]